jgi:hypothetical protein
MLYVYGQEKGALQGIEHMTYDRALRLFQRHMPHDTFRAQSASDWCGLDPLPPDIAVYYKRVGPHNVELPQFANPDLPQFAAPIYLPSLRDLWLYQEPYQFNISTWELEPTWHDGWFFLADLQNDEYGHLVFDSTTSQVLKVIYDKSGWISHPLVRNLETMALVLAILTTPVSEFQTPRDREASLNTILTQLHEVLPDHEIRTIVTELKWRYRRQII